MTLEKAIEILDDTKDFVLLHKAFDSASAIQLGIEALKRLEKARKERRFDRLGLLPGETKE